jgi:hypothetical protein
MNTAQEYKNPETPRELLTRWLKRLRESQFAHNEATKHFGRCHYFIGIPAATLSTIVGTSVRNHVQEIMSMNDDGGVQEA